MHLFLDESGGCAPSDRCFLVAGVLIAPELARRVMRRFRRAAGLTGEVRGHGLTLEQRQLFFDLLLKQSNNISATVVCEREAGIGGWGMNELPEHILRAEMVVEVCELLAATDLFQLNAAAVPRIGVTQDGGRYKRALLAAAQQQITTSLATRIAGISFTVRYGDSARTDGLQIADIIGNTVFREFSGGDAGTAAGRLLDAARRAARLHVRPVALEGRRPDWMALTEDGKAARRAAFPSWRRHPRRSSCQ